MKKLYKVSTAYDEYRLNTTAPLGRSWEVVAVDAQQAIRKALYNLARSKKANKTLDENEYINEVVLLGKLQIK